MSENISEMKEIVIVSRTRINNFIVIFGQPRIKASLGPLGPRNYMSL